MIKKCKGDKWCVYSKDGSELLGEHDTEKEAKAQLAAIEASKYAKKYNDIQNVEIFKTGTHNGTTFDESDLAEMEKAFNELDFLPALKVGHTNDSSLPAYGYLQNIRKVGNTLLADLVNIPNDIYQAIREKKFGRVSAEVYFNFKRDGKVFKRVVSALALLGQSVPGVSGLKPLYKMFSAEDSAAAESTAHIEFAIGIVKDSQSEAIEGDEMSEELKQYQQKVDDLQKKLTAAEDSAKALEQAQATLKVNFEAENKALKKQIADAEIKAKTAGLPPSIRQYFEALYTFASDTEMKTFSLKLDDKAQDKSQQEVIAALAEFMVKKFSHLMQDEKGGETKDAMKDNTYTNASDEVEKRVKKYMADNKEAKYSVAMKSVLDADAKLKGEYLAVQGV